MVVIVVVVKLLGYNCLNKERAAFRVSCNLIKCRGNKDKSRSRSKSWIKNKR